MDIKNIIANNVKRLVDNEGLTIKKLGSESGTGFGTVHRLMNPTDSAQNPTLNTLTGVSAALKVRLWKLFFDNMPLELFFDVELDEVIQKLSKCSWENRQEIYRQIHNIAEKDYMEKRLNEIESGNNRNT